MLTKEQIIDSGFTCTNKFLFSTKDLCFIGNNGTNINYDFKTGILYAAKIKMVIIIQVIVV